MRAVIQRVSDASVTVHGQLIGSIEHGLLVYVGVTHSDTEKDVSYMAHKIVNMRVFEDDQGKMNLSLKDIGGKMLVVSQFTLYGDMNKGHRPSFNKAAEPKQAHALYELFMKEVEQKEVEVQTGLFGEHMKVAYTNDGPVTIVLDSPLREV